MSACISRHGEYSEHTPDAEWTCTLCGDVDAAGLLDEVYRLRHENADLRRSRDERKATERQRRTEDREAWMRAHGGEAERLREVVAVADRVAASLGLVLHDAHPTYGSTALWGGIGGQAITSHCSIVNGAHPGGEWAEFDLPSHYLREWVSLRGADYDHDEMKATVRADLLDLLNPTEGETRER